MRNLARSTPTATYSSRSATTGSTRTARSADGTAAKPEATRKHARGSARLRKSTAFTSNSNVESNRPRVNPPLRQIENERLLKS